MIAIWYIQCHFAKKVKIENLRVKPDKGTIYLVLNRSKQPAYFKDDDGDFPLLWDLLEASGGEMRFWLFQQTQTYSLGNPYSSNAKNCGGGGGGNKTHNKWICRAFAHFFATVFRNKGLKYFCQIAHLHCNLRSSQVEEDSESKENVTFMIDCDESRKK